MLKIYKIIILALHPIYAIKIKILRIQKEIYKLYFRNLHPIDFWKIF